MWQARRRFDRRKSSFRTFAMIRGKGAMIDGLRKTAWPRQLRKMRRLIEVAHAEAAERGEILTRVQLAARLKVSVQRLERYSDQLNIAERTSGIVETTQRDAGDVPGWLVGGRLSNPEAMLIKTRLTERLRAVFHKLDSREQWIVERYYYGDATMIEIGAELGINESRVSQLHARMIEKFRAWLVGVAEVRQ